MFYTFYPFLHVHYLLNVSRNFRNIEMHRCDIRLSFDNEKTAYRRDYILLYSQLQVNQMILIA